jgi:sortase (surface protein transpeptidase)
MEFAGDAKRPVRLQIEFLEVDAAVVDVGVTAGGDMDTTKEPYGIAWYEKGSAPGWSGNALMAGHNYWNGVPGSFVYLSYLPVGEKVLIEYEDGSTGEFSVISNATYELEDIPASVMVPKDGNTRTTLISCNGKNIPGFGYTQRTIVLLKALALNEAAT